MAIKQLKERPVVVTTSYKGVFFGYTTDSTGEQITLKRARLCVYWSTDMKGFMGLVAFGPSANCKIGPPVAEIDVRSVTSVMEVGEEAEQKWLKASIKW